MLWNRTLFDRVERALTEATSIESLEALRKRYAGSAAEPRILATLGHRYASEAKLAEAKALREKAGTITTKIGELASSGKLATNDETVATLKSLVQELTQINEQLKKMQEEIEEIKNAETDFELASEIGDLLFALVNVARWKHVDAESALRATNMKFRKRFAHVEQGAKKQGRDLSALSLDEMESLWQEAKKKQL